MVLDQLSHIVNTMKKSKGGETEEEALSSVSHTFRLHLRKQKISIHEKKGTKKTSVRFAMAINTEAP